MMHHHREELRTSVHFQTNIEDAGGYPARQSSRSNMRFTIFSLHSQIGRLLQRDRL